MPITPEAAWSHIRTLLERIPDPEIKLAYVTFHDQHRELALTQPAAVKHHHAWTGGYPVHICEVMMNLRAILQNVKLPKDLGFTALDSITASYVHDLDKLLYRYELDGERPTGPQIKYAQDLGLTISNDETKTTISARIDAKKNGEVLDETRMSRHRYREGALDFEDGAIVMKLCHDHGLFLSEHALHAVCTHHGGYSSLARSKSNLDVAPLGVFLHTADYISSNVQLGNVELPVEKEEPLTGTRSILDQSGLLAPSLSPDWRGHTDAVGIQDGGLGKTSQQVFAPPPPPPQ